MIRPYMKTKELPKRRSVRLVGYDYSGCGFYFITICCKDFKCLFGEIKHDKTILNELGETVKHCWKEIPNHYPQVKLHDFVIMPNHLHGIIEIVGANHHSPEEIISENKHPKGTSNTIGAMVRGFKIGVTKWGKANQNISKIWQRGFHEHIIKNDSAYQKISDYIIENPVRWDKDKFYVSK